MQKIHFLCVHCIHFIVEEQAEGEVEQVGDPMHRSVQQQVHRLLHTAIYQDQNIYLTDIRIRCQNQKS